MREYIAMKDLIDKPVIMPRQKPSQTSNCYLTTIGLVLILLDLVFLVCLTYWTFKEKSEHSKPMEDLEILDQNLTGLLTKSWSIQPGIYLAHFSSMYQVNGTTEDCYVKILLNSVVVSEYPFLRKGYKVLASKAIFKFEFAMPLEIPKLAKLKLEITNHGNCKRFLMNNDQFKPRFLCVRLNRNYLWRIYLLDFVIFSVLNSSIERNCYFYISNKVNTMNFWSNYWIWLQRI